MTQASPELRVFLDRSVGTRKLASSLRQRGIDVETMFDRCGEGAATVDDITWITDATADDRALVGADRRIRHNPLERAVLCRTAARCFTFANGNMTADQMIALFTGQLTTITELARRPGPYVYHLTAGGVRRQKLDCEDVGW